MNSCVNCIHRNWAFKNLSDKELELINCKRTEKFYSKGETIFTEGEPVNFFFNLKSGLVKLHKKENNNREHIISITKPRDFIGLLSIFSNSTHKYTITAIEDSAVCLIEPEIIKNLIKTNGAFAIDFLEKFNAITDTLIKIRTDINTRQLRGRIAYILIFFSKHIYKSASFSLPISRKEVAELIDMSTENVIRVLSEFRRDKLIQIKGKTIEILDINLLERIYEFG